PGPRGAASVAPPIRLARRRVSRAFTFRAVTHQLEQVPVGIEEVEAIVIAPVDRRMIWDAALREKCLGGLQAVPSVLEAMMALAERVPPLLEIERPAIGPEEQRAGRLAAAHDDLVGQTHLDRHAEHVAIEALGAPEVGHVHAEVIEPLELQEPPSPPAP